MDLMDIAASLEAWAVYDAASVGEARAAAYRGMADGIRAHLAAAVPAKVGRVRSARAPAAMGAVAFWDAHGAAVRAIAARYGGSWRCGAPLGETELVSLPSRLTSFKTERGTTIRWARDHRMPSARYWPGGVLPDGLTGQRDYARASVEEVAGPRAMYRYSLAWAEYRAIRVVRKAKFRRAGVSYDHGAAVSAMRRVLAARRALRDLGFTPWALLKPFQHDDAWHEANGYVRGPCLPVYPGALTEGCKLNDEWIPEILARQNAAHAEAIADLVAWREAQRVSCDAEADADRIAA